jgi:hypothetical protein
MKKIMEWLKGLFRKKEEKWVWLGDEFMDKYEY